MSYNVYFVFNMFVQCCVLAAVYDIARLFPNCFKAITLQQDKSFTSGKHWRMPQVFRVDFPAKSKSYISNSDMSS